MIDFGQLEQQNGLPQGLLSAVMQQESGGNPNAVSPAGATGAFQFMPQTAQQYGINPNNPDQSAQAAATMLGQLSQKYNGSLPHMLAGYNWGQGNVDRQGLQNAPSETQNYIGSIMARLATPNVSGSGIINPNPPKGQPTPLPWAPSGTAPPQQNASSGGIMNAIGNFIMPSANAAEIPQNTFDVQMPDGTVIKGVPQGTTQSQLQAKLGKLQTGQPTSQPTAQTETAAPNPAPNPQTIGNNQQDLIQSLHNWSMSPTNVNLSDLPQTGQGLSTLQKLGFGAQAVGRGLLGSAEQSILKPTVKGVSELMQGSAGQIAPGQNLSPEGVMTLGMMSPTLGKGLPPAEGYSEPIGNRMLKNISGPSDMANSEETMTNQLMATGTPKPVQGSTLMAGVQARTPEEYQSAVESMRDAVNPIWSQMRQAGDALKPEPTSGLMESIDNSLSDMSNKYIPQLNPKTTAIIEAMKDEASKGMLGVSDIDQYRRLLSRVGGSEDGFSAGVARKTIDGFLNNLSGDDLVSGTTESVDLLNQARAQSAQAFKAQDIADILSKANGDPNRIKALLSNFVAKKENLVGYTQQEKDALRFAANTGIGQNVLKSFGKFGIDFSKSGTGNTVLPALMSLGKIGAAPLIPGGIPAVMAATAMRQGQKYMARGAAEQAFRIFEGGE